MGEHVLDFLRGILGFGMVAGMHVAPDEEERDRRVNELIAEAERAIEELRASGRLQARKMADS